MNSSNIFKKDDRFTPISLVRQRGDSQTTGRQTPTPVPAQPLQDVPPDAENHPDSPPSQDLPLEEHHTAAEPGADLAQLREEAYQQGQADLATAYADGIHHAAQALSQACTQLEETIRHLTQRDWNDTVRLIVAFSKKIIGRELRLAESTIATTLQAALEQAIAAQEFQVTLNPEDLALAEEQEPALLAAIAGLERLHFKTDASIERGGCLLEAENGLVDARIVTQIESLSEFFESQSELAELTSLQELAQAPSPAALSPAALSPAALSPAALSPEPLIFEPGLPVPAAPTFLNDPLEADDLDHDLDSIQEQLLTSAQSSPDIQHAQPSQPERSDDSEPPASKPVS